MQNIYHIHFAIYSNKECMIVLLKYYLPLISQGEKLSAVYTSLILSTTCQIK